MEFIGPLQRNRLDRINDLACTASSSVDAAVAYIHDESTLIRKCFENKVPLHIRGRYDYGTPVSVSILEKFLKCTNSHYRLTLVPDIFHPKVIWWHGYGVYIGSANLTHSAWFSNIEAGCFFDEEEITEQNLREDLEAFFDYVDEKANELSEGIVAQLRNFRPDPEMRKMEKEARRQFEENRLIPKLQDLDSVQKISASKTREAEFLREWNSTLKILNDIGQKLAAYRPVWVPEGTSGGTHADQFLHGYYYQKVRGDSANEHPYEDFHAMNKGNVDLALEAAMVWWKGLETPPNDEDRMINEWAASLQNYLAEDRIKSLSAVEFSDMCSKIHAFRNHSLRVSYTALGLSGKLPKMDGDDRMAYVANWLYKQRSATHRSPLDLLHWVLYGGPKEEVPKRIFSAGYDPGRKIPHMGLSMLGESVGWAMPDDYPPRNGRTSKALRALGFSNKVHGK